MTRTTLPIALPGGELVPHMSSRRRHEVCDVVFEMLGGPDRLYTEANKSSEAYWEFMKFWGKGLPRAVATEHTVSDGVEALLDKLDAKERAVTINADAVDITPLDSE